MGEVKLFQDTSAAQDILEDAKRSGVAGIYGGRLAVRALTRDVARLVEQFDADADEELQGEVSIWSSQTYNHSQTELAYVYDANRFRPDQALQAVIAAYELFNPPSEWL